MQSEYSYLHGWIYYSVKIQIDFITIATLGDAFDFGDQPHQKIYNGAVASPTRCFHSRCEDTPSYV